MAKKELLPALKKVVIALLFTGITMVSADDITEVKVSQTTISKKNKKQKNKILNISVTDKNFALDLARRSRQIGMESIREKYQELQAMVSDRPGEDFGLAREAAESDRANISLKVFISSSMKPSLLKDYVKSARKYGAILVFNGLPGGSWQALSQLVQEITLEQQDQGWSKGKWQGSIRGDKEVAIQIDDKAFAKYGVNSVPCFVLAKEENWMSLDASSSDSGSSEDIREVFDKVAGNIGIKRALAIFAEEGELSAEATEIMNIRSSNNKHD